MTNDLDPPSLIRAEAIHNHRSRALRRIPFPHHDRHPEDHARLILQAACPHVAQSMAAVYVLKDDLKQLWDDADLAGLHLEVPAAMVTSVLLA